MKKTIKLLSLLLALCFALSLVACGGSDADTDADADKDNSSVASKVEDTSSIDTNSTITMPDFEFGGLGEEKTTFVNSGEAQTMTIETYHKDNELLSFTMTLKMPFGDKTEDEMKVLKDTYDQQFAEASTKDYISYTCLLVDNELSLVIAIRDLDVKEHKEYMVQLHLYDGYTVDDTFEDLETYLLGHGYVKQ